MNKAAQVSSAFGLVGVAAACVLVAFAAGYMRGYGEGLQHSPNSPPPAIFRSIDRISGSPGYDTYLKQAAPESQPATEVTPPHAKAWE